MIEGQVAAILNALELAINRGEKDGVTEGMRFEVLEKEGVPITDPETGEELGEEVAIKIRVRIVRVEQEYSVARSYEATGGFEPIFGMSALLKGRAPTLRTLRTDEALFPALKEAESYVKRGDPVREIVE